MGAGGVAGKRQPAKEQPAPALSPLTAQAGGPHILTVLIEGSMCATVDKNDGERVFECEQLYFPHYDRMFPIASGGHIESLAVRKFSRRTALEAWS